MTSMTRPGGRTARVREAVLRATGDVLAESGFAVLDLAEVARRADVGRTTVYRRWGTPTALVADLLLAMAADSLPRTRTGSIADDLQANARLVQSTLADARQGRLFAAVVVAGACDSDAAEALHGFYATRVDEWAPCVDEAVERGELPVGTDARQVIRAVSAPLYYALLQSGQQITEELADQSAHATLAAAQAGVFVTVGR